MEQKFLNNIQEQSDNLPSFNYRFLFIIFSVHEDRDFSISIFIVDGHARIPLHNHPEMHGLLQVKSIFFLIPFLPCFLTDLFISQDFIYFLGLMYTYLIHYRLFMAP